MAKKDEEVKTTEVPKMGKASEVPKTETVLMVRLDRSSDGPNEADVHPDNVADMIAHGWSVKREGKP